MKHLLYSLLLISFSSFGQLPERITNLEKTILEYEDQTIFQHDGNTFSYHVQGDHIAIYNSATNMLIYRSDINICDDIVISVFQRNGSMFYVMPEGIPWVVMTKKPEVWPRQNKDRRSE